LASAGYHAVERTASLKDTLFVTLYPLTVHLNEFTLHEMTQFQKDSAELATTYKKELDKRPIKPKVKMDGGLSVSGLIGAPVQRMSRSYKQNKKFREAFQKDMEQRFIDTRYKPELVTSLTGMKGDSLVQFMNTHPMDYTFARTASDLEVKIWIRESYKAYLDGKQPAAKE
jgi:hypothetical protein